jgi:hypothetical protein
MRTYLPIHVQGNGIKVALRSEDMVKGVVASKAKIGGGQPRDPGPYVMRFKLWVPKLSLTLAWEISPHLVDM